MIVNTFSPFKKNAVLSCIVPKLHKLKYNELNQICYFIFYFRGMIRTYNLQEMSGGLKLSLTLIFALISSITCSEFYQQDDLTMSCEKESNGTMTWRITHQNDTKSVNNICETDRYAVCNADYYFCLNGSHRSEYYCRRDMYKCRNTTDLCNSGESHKWDEWGEKLNCWECFRTVAKVTEELDEDCKIDIPMLCPGVKAAYPVILLGKKGDYIFMQRVQTYGTRCFPDVWSGGEFWFFYPFIGSCVGGIFLGLVLITFGILACFRGNMCRSQCCVKLCSSCIN